MLPNLPLLSLRFQVSQGNLKAVNQRSGNMARRTLSSPVASRALLNHKIFDYE